MQESINVTYKFDREEILNDYKIALKSRHCSLIGRKEVLGGKAKFGIFGDGKEIAQLAMAKFFAPGDWRSGYYRDQTFMMATGELNCQQFFAQLYAHASLEADPASGGRQMNCHFATRYLDSEGQWLDQVKSKNSSADISPTGGQMARSLGLAYSSKLYRESKSLLAWPGAARFSKKGNEVVFATIGNASTSEGLFWETLNAAGVLQVPLVISVWDDGYGISVPNQLQTTKNNIFNLLKGFQEDQDGAGFELYSVDGNNYELLMKTYEEAVNHSRTTGKPALVHCHSLTQPQGHSTSGSHERYKSPERLKFEEDADGLRNMRSWMLEQGISESICVQIEDEALKEVTQAKELAWQAFTDSLKEGQQTLCTLLDAVIQGVTDTQIRTEIKKIATALEKSPLPLKKVTQSAGVQALNWLRGQESQAISQFRDYLAELKDKNQNTYSSELLTEGSKSPLQIHAIEKVPSKDKEDRVDGREIIRDYFDIKLQNDPRIVIFGEDVGDLGGVNLEFEGLQEKYGNLRVTDTGIREATILGQGIGTAMRGLRPIADIQYLDYLIYALQGMSDDLCTLRYRTAGGQAAPLIVRTKGHRLEGIWHTGSPMSMLLGSLRGMHICVPRDCTQAAGMYETIFRGDDPALVIEVLNGYRVKEQKPLNLGEYRVPLGVPEVLQQGDDITVVTYGANVRLVQSLFPTFEKFGVSVELIDVQTLLPFDTTHIIKDSLRKTNMILFLDEDVPGGATSYMMQKVLEEQKGYDFLDAEPRTLCAKEHRSAYGSDGDYFSKPNAEDLLTLVLDMIFERFPERIPKR